MRLPRPERQLVLFPCRLERLIARLVSEVIGKFRPLRAGHQMQNRVVSGEHLLLSLSEIGQNVPELLVRDIRLVVKQRPVVNDEHVLLRNHLSAFECQPFFMQLVADDKILKIQHRHTVSERADSEARDKLRCRLRDRDHLPAVVLLELLENAADERRFTGCGASGQDDSCDALCHSAGSSPCSAHIVPFSGKNARAARKNAPRCPCFLSVTAQTGCCRASRRSRSAPEAPRACPAR